METNESIFLFGMILGLVIGSLALGLIVLIYHFLTFKKQIMKKVEELEQKINEQNEAIAEEHRQVAEKIGELEASVTALEEQLSETGTSEQIQTLIDKVKENTSNLKKIYVTPGEEETGDEDEEQPTT